MPSPPASRRSALRGRPRDLATQQAAASVGQGLLVHRYTEAFARHGLVVGQVLLTADDVVRRTHYRNAHRTLDRLLELGALPVVNENDTVATDEIRFGDNDRLAALVAHLVHADLLVLLSDVDGLYDGDPRRTGSTLITAGRAASDDLRTVHLGKRRAGRRRHRRHADQGRGGADRDRRRRPGGPRGSADDARAALAGEAVGTYFAATGAPGADPAALAGPRHRRRAGGCTSTPARCGRGRAAGVAAARGRRLGRRGVRGRRPGGPGRTRRRAVARGSRHSGPTELPDLLGRSTRELARGSGARTSARSSTATTWCCWTERCWTEL